MPKTDRIITRKGLLETARYPGTRHPAWMTPLGTAGLRGDLSINKQRPGGHRARQSAGLSHLNSQAGCALGGRVLILAARKLLTAGRSVEWSTFNLLLSSLQECVETVIHTGWRCFPRGEAVGGKAASELRSPNGKPCWTAPR